VDTGAGVPGDLVVLGGDIGGTSTRIVVVDRAGEVLGRGVAGGGNPISNPDTAAVALGEALGRALHGLDPVRVRAAVIGVAGGGSLGDASVGARFARAWSSAGLTCEPGYRSDLEVAFASGTAEPDGSVLIAGTGAVAGVISDHRLGHTVDGHGWLLGDDGSGFWIGRQAVRAALRSLESDEAPGVLVRSVLNHLDADHATGRDSERARVIRAVHARPPVRLSELAPLVTAAYAVGDPVADRIVDGAVRRLAESLDRIRAGDRPGPLVLAGSLTREDSPIGARLRSLLAERLVTEPVTARDEVVGAAWLALLATEPGSATPQLWGRLTSMTKSDRTDS